MFDKKISLEEHQQIIENILKAHELQIESIFNIMDKEIERKSQTIKSIKYATSNTLRFSLKSIRSKILMDFRNIVRQFKDSL